MKLAGHPSRGWDVPPVGYPNYQMSRAISLARGHASHSTCDTLVSVGCPTVRAIPRFGGASHSGATSHAPAECPAAVGCPASDGLTQMVGCLRVRRAISDGGMTQHTLPISHRSDREDDIQATVTRMSQQSHEFNIQRRPGHCAGCVPGPGPGAQWPSPGRHPQRAKALSCPHGATVATPVAWRVMASGGRWERQAG